jgi:hypothetical protein
MSPSRELYTTPLLLRSSLTGGDRPQANIYIRSTRTYLDGSRTLKLGHAHDEIAK